MVKFLCQKLLGFVFLITFSLSIKSQGQPWNNIHYEWHKINTGGVVKFVRNDSFGNSWFVGTFTGTVNFNPEGSDVFTSNGGSDVFLTKRDPDGNYLFTKTFGGTGNDDVHQVEMYMGTNRPTLYGTFNGVVNFNPNPTAPVNRGGSGERAYVLRLTGNGGFNWVRVIGGDLSTIEIGSLAVDPATGECSISGLAMLNNSERVVYIHGAAEAGSDLNYVNTTGGLRRVHFLIKTNGNGQADWFGTYFNAADASSHALYMENNEILFGGSFLNCSYCTTSPTDFFGGNPSSVLDHPGDGINKLYLLKYDYSGTYLGKNDDLTASYPQGGRFSVNGNNLYYTVFLPNSGVYTNSVGANITVTSSGFVLFRFDEASLNLIDNRFYSGYSPTHTGSPTTVPIIQGSLSADHTQIHFRNELGTDYMFFGAYNSSGFNVFKMELDFSNEVVLATLGQRGNYWFDGNFLWHGTSSAVALPTNYDPNGTQIESTAVAHAKYSICQLGTGSNTSDFAFCEGSLSTIPATETTASQWYWYDGVFRDYWTSTGELVFDPIYSSNEGNYTVWSNQNECVWIPETINIEVQPSLTLGIVSINESEVCVGDNVILNGGFSAGTASGVLSAGWTGPSGFSHVGDVINFDALSNSGGWYYYEVSETDITTCSDIDSVFLTVNNLPVFDVAAAVSVSAPCEGGLIELSAQGVGGVSYSWTGPNGFTSSAQNPIIDPVSPINSGTYSVLLTDLVTGCNSVGSPSSSVVVNVETVPTVSAITAPIAPVCRLYDTLTLVVDVDAGLTDYTTTWFSGFNPFTGNPTFIEVGDSISVTNQGNYSSGIHAGVYYVEVVDNTNGCVFLDSVNVHTYSVPINASDGTLSYDFLTNHPPGVTAKCENDSLIAVWYHVNDPIVWDFSGYNAQGALYDSANFVYQTTGPTINGVEYYSESMYQTFHPLLPEHSGYYTTIITDTVTGCYNIVDFTLLIHPAAVIEPELTAGGCEGDDVTISSGVNTNSGTWFQYDWTGPNGFSSSDSLIVIDNASSLDNGWYHIVVENSAGCFQYDSLLLDIVSAPSVDGNLGVNPSAELCVGDTAYFWVQNNTDWSYTWTGPNGFVANEQNPVIAPVELSDAGIYTVIITDLTNGCESVFGLDDWVDLVVNDLPSTGAGAWADDNSPCEGGVIELFADSVNSVGYSWSGPNGFSSDAQNPVISATLNNSGVYTVVVTDLNTGCSSTLSVGDSVFIDVIEAPYLDPLYSNADNNEVCYDEDVVVIGNGTFGDVYWTGPNGFEYWGESFVLTDFGSEQSGWYIATVVDSVYGCLSLYNSGTDSIYVLGINCNIVIPDIFTPGNNDGVNDGFEIPGIELYPGTSLRVFNRWGTEVFYREDYQNDWMGQSESSFNVGAANILPEGTYFYLIILGGTQEVYKGNVYLKR